MAEMLLLRQENQTLRQENLKLCEENQALREENLRLSNELAVALQRIQQQDELISTLRDEIAELKGTPKRPRLPPSNLEGPKSQGNADDKKSKPGRGKHPRKKKKKKLEIHVTTRVAPANLPEGAFYKGFRVYDVQEIVFHTVNTRYELERWMLPDGTYVQGVPPSGTHGHYGSNLHAYVLQQTYQCRVPEGLLLQQLHEMGVLISAGQLHKLVTTDCGGFHAEKAEVLKAAIATGELQTDDVGARHMGRNCFTNVICNDFCVVLTTTGSKSRVNFLEVLSQGRCEYLLNEDAFRQRVLYSLRIKLIGTPSSMTLAIFPQWTAAA